MDSKKRDRAKKRTTPSRGRPGLYSKAAGVRICEAVAAGEALTVVCRREGVGMSTLFRWEEVHDDFREGLTRAREARLQTLKEQLLELSDEAWQAGKEEECSTQRISSLHFAYDGKLRYLAQLEGMVAARRQEIELTGRDGAPLVPSVPALTEERLAHIAELQARFTVQLEQERAGEDKLGEAQDGFAG